MKDIKFVSTNTLVSFSRPFSKFENGLRKEAKILVETNFRSFVVLYIYRYIYIYIYIYVYIYIYIL